MKRLYSLLFIFIYLLGYSQTILTQQETSSRTVEDPHIVILGQGFRATSSISNPFIAKIESGSQSGGGVVDSNAGASNPSGTNDNNVDKFYDTKGNIDVNGAGQLQFSLPIALPPGVKSVAPQINLVYVSGSGNGIAGYGWNISGITAITRIAKNIERDGNIKGVQLDYSDFYQFNGQRLILKSGEYGKNGAEYVTEKFSNIKIKSVGAISGQLWEGPEYWEVTFEDGSQAWYGFAPDSGVARTANDYALVKWKDNKGNAILYKYDLFTGTNQGGVLSISSIKWGGNENLNQSHFNEIKFNYINRELTETAFLKGIEFIQSKLLSHITVYTNQSQFKKYVISYTNHNTGYHFVNKITEYNANNEVSNPVSFQYNPPITGNEETSYQYNLTNYNTKKYADFNIDGIPDYIEFVSNGNIRYRNSVYESTSAIQLQYDVTKFTSNDFKYATPITFKKNGYVKNSSMGLVIPVSKSNTVTNQNDFEFQVYSIDFQAGQLVFEFSKIIPYSQISPYLPDSDFEICEISPPLIYGVYNYDFNGDGMSEIIAKFTIFKTCTSPDPPEPPVTFKMQEDIMVYSPSVDSSNTEVVETNDNTPPVDNIGANQTRTSYSNYVLIDLDPEIPIVNSSYKIQGYYSAINFADFDGDGLQDIFFTTNKLHGVINIDRDETLSYSTRDVGNFAGLNFIGTEYSGILIGDFNGDQKSDILIPQVDKGNNWDLYVSNGKNFEKFYVNHFIYYSKETEILSEDIHNTTFESGCRYAMSRYFQYNVGDLDGDGKSEIIVSHVLLKDHQWNAHRDKEWTKMNVVVYSLNKLAGATNKTIVYNTLGGENNIDYPIPISTNSPFSFYRTLNKTKTYYEKVIPFSTLSLNRENQQLVFVGKPVDCQGAECDYNYVYRYNYLYLPRASQLKSIEQAGILTSITYKELNPSQDNTFYKPVKSEMFPFGEIERIPLSSVVYQLKQSSGMVSIAQDFRYRGFLTHYQGKGMIGFRQSARSVWYSLNSPNDKKVWNGTEIDPLNDSVPIKEWSVWTNDISKVFPVNLSETNNELISFKSTEYNTDKIINGQVVTSVPLQDRHKVVVSIVPVKYRKKDILTNVVVEDNIVYGDYYFPVQTISNVNNGYSVSTTAFAYSHNLSGSGENYFLGRLVSKNVTVSAYGDTKSAKEDYTYENNLLKSLKTWNRDNSGFLQETYSYDGFGNIIQKTITNSVDSQARTVASEYDSKGRFVVKKTDNLGLETFITYNNWGQILTQTDPAGNQLTNTYDGWGKILTSKSNLSGTTSYVYEKLNPPGQGIAVTEFSPDDNQTTTYTNVWGQNYRIITKGFSQGKFVAKDIEYDALGRKTAESEPYFEGEGASQWNLYAYDDAVFPAKVEATTFTGKKMETSVSGNITFVKEMNGYNRITSKTADALGNVVSSEDKGGIIEFRYNAAGEQIQAKYGNNIVFTEYDEWGRKAVFNDPSNGIYQYKYDAFGQIKKLRSPKGIKEYAYNGFGQLVTQKEFSESDGGHTTDKTISFAYDDKGRLISRSGTSKGNAFSNSVVYDSYGRLLSSAESSNGKYFVQKGIIYDDQSRVVSYEKILYSSGTETKVTIENGYSSWNGGLYQVKDHSSGRVLWELQNTNAKGQVLTADLGRSVIQNTYASDGFLTNINHSSPVKPDILQISYSFDAVKNELNARTTGGDFNILESFDYDDNNRLVNWTDPVTGQPHENVYDEKGRIIENDQIGKIKFENSAKIYQPTKMELTQQGQENYNNDLVQRISYNENNDPVYIDGEKGDVAFQYGLSSMRQRVTYGGNFGEEGDGQFTKYYSEDGSFEIIRNNHTGEEKHLIYIGGTPYESNIVYLKNYTESSGSFKFLHKDYLGSILAITDEDGNKLEQRHFDAWGNLTHLQIGDAVYTDKYEISAIMQEAGGLIIDRGYTSHEHFFEVGLIHMNGRLYDPLLRRFLNADENIQDPYNTQVYNKYGYVINNPLMFNDPGGEIFGFGFLASAVIIGAFIGAASYTLSALITGQKFSLLGLFTSTIFGAVSGAVTCGIGNIFTPAIECAAQAGKVLSEIGLVFLQSAAHGIAQGTLAMMQGGNFVSGAVSGMFGSLGAAGFGAAAGEFAKTAEGIVLSGAVLGGIGSELTGGNFWQGALVGGIVAGLNHAMHSIDGPDDPPMKKYKFKDAKAKWQSREGGYVDVDASTIDWSNADLLEPGNAKGTYRVRLDGRNRANTDDALVHGTVTIEPVSGKPGYYQMAMDGETGCRCGRYDFEMKNNEWFSVEGFKRNVATFGGKILNGMNQYNAPRGVLMIPIRTYVGGSPFTIRYNGIFKIGK